MDYHPNTVIDATPFIERSASAGTDPFGIVSTPFLVEAAVVPGIVDGFLAQGVSSGRAAYQPETTAVLSRAVAQDQATDLEDALTQLATRRVALIQARNASLHATVELKERLRILNERMNQQSPRVTDAHLRSIEDAVALGERVASRRAARMARLSR